MSGSEPVIRVAGAGDAAALHAALRALAADLGDPFRAAEADIAAALAGPRAFALALLAGGAPPAGAALAAPVMSTMAGGAVLHVSDLWVAAPARGRSLGRRLLAAAAREGRARWGTRGLTLTVYDGNAGARAFYARLGFRLRAGDHGAYLDADGIAALEGQAA
jgi:ribosomal protein S18 acetylase RimI-like enzyme